METIVLCSRSRGPCRHGVCRVGGRSLQREGYANLLAVTSPARLGLEDGPAMQRLFADHQPSVLVLTAAKGGGIPAKNSKHSNLLLEKNSRTRPV